MKRTILAALLLLIVQTLAIGQQLRPVQPPQQVPTLEGTVWVGKINAPDSDGAFHDYDYQFEFLANNVLHWRWEGQSYTNGVWHQVGYVVCMELNDRYSMWAGAFDRTRMRGFSSNKLGHNWEWTLTPQTVTAQTK
ncbi:MAG TPA: hypothetical protein VK619_18165 [Pyrinomonadaceae bacterium]|nr:hypothetical protein [Pyrinomonadaceae bacterium]